MHVPFVNRCSSNIIFGHFQDFFDLKNLASGFIQFHELSSHVLQQHPQFLVCIFGDVTFGFGQVFRSHPSNYNGQGNLLVDE